MAKTGRNERCPCGSGKKFKRCCGLKSRSEMRRVVQNSGKDAASPTLMAAIEQVQRDASAKRVVTAEVGVFFFFTDKDGDGWLLEMTDQDAIKVAEAGVALDPGIEEDPETIEVNWSHRYVIEDRRLKLIDWQDETSFVVDDAPTGQLNAAMRRLRKRFTAEQLDQVHIDHIDVPEEGGAALRDE